MQGLWLFPFFNSLKLKYLYVVLFPLFGNVKVEDIQIQTETAIVLVGTKKTFSFYIK